MRWLCPFGSIASLVLTASGCGDAGAAQPIPFPHALHTENQIDCAFCHEFSDRQAAAGIPRSELCGSCHMAMPQESEASRKLMEYVDAGRQIEWVRLYQLPQYTHFSHKWHVRADVACEECHWNVGGSTVAVRHMDLKMAWCIDCHEQRNAPVDCVVCHK